MHGRTGSPTLRFERQLLSSGATLLCSVDEVGRGALSGPVSVGMVLIDVRTGTAPKGVKDSKLLTPEARLALVPRIQERYGIAVELYKPVAESVVHFVKTNGEKAMYDSIELRKACCAMRKLEPLSRMLAGASAWVTGLRREQSDNRGGVPFSEPDPNGGPGGRTKFNPLADWTWADIWHYIEQNNVPYNALHDQFMPSIGCEPCTRAIAVGEEFRAGRWWWEDEKSKECGLHVRPEAESAETAEA